MSPTANVIPSTQNPVAGFSTWVSTYKVKEEGGVRERKLQTELTPNDNVAQFHFISSKKVNRALVCTIPSFFVHLETVHTSNELFWRGAPSLAAPCDVICTRTSWLSHPPPCSSMILVIKLSPHHNMTFRYLFLILKIEGSCFFTHATHLPSHLWR
jgi:hypothetical protein